MSFDARLYRLLHRGNPGDLDFYRDACIGAVTVLELGCGDGRITVPLAAAGHDVTGLDAHPGMLAAARKRRAALPRSAKIRFVRGDMADFDLARRYDRVLIPYTALYCLDPTARARCLHHVVAHLAPGGRLVFDLYPGDTLAGRPAFEDDEPEWIDALRDGDRIVEIYESDRHDPAHARMDVTYLHRICTPDGRARVVEYTLTHHYLRLAELAPTLAAAGLTVLSLTGDFDGRPATPTADRMVVIAQAKADHELE